MESTYKKVLTIGILYGLILGIAVNVNVQIWTWLGLGMTLWVIVIDLVLLVAVVLLAHRAFKKAIRVRMSFLQGLSINFIAVLIMNVLQKGYLLIYLNFIEPGWVNKVIEMRTALLVARGASTEVVNGLAEKLTASFSAQNMLTRGVLFGVIWGMIFAGIVTIFTIWLRNPYKNRQ